MDSQLFKGYLLVSESYKINQNTYSKPLSIIPSMLTCVSANRPKFKPVEFELELPILFSRKKYIFSVYLSIGMALLTYT